MIRAQRSASRPTRPSSLRAARYGGRSGLGAAAGLVFMLVAGAAGAQTPPAGKAGESAARPGCGAPQREAATPKASGPDAGTAPGGAGSTGWSGGTGGSFVGTTPQGAASGSSTQHPETVQGLNPQPGAPSAC